MKNRFPLNKVIAVDVDGTLFINGEPNKPLVEWCQLQKEDGYFMILWSARGENHARAAADLTGLNATFDCIIGKPGYIVDNNGWRWTRFTKVVLWRHIIDKLKFTAATTKKGA